MSRCSPRETVADVDGRHRKRRAWLFGAAAVWPIAVLLGSEAWGLDEATPTDQTVETATSAEAPAASAPEAIPLRGRLGARLAAAEPMPPAETPPALSDPSDIALEPLSGMPAAQLAAPGSAARAWPPLNHTPRRVEPSPYQLEPPEPAPTPEPEPRAAPRRSSGGWPAIAAPQPYLAVALAAPAPISAPALDTLEETPGSVVGASSVEAQLTAAPAPASVEPATAPSSPSALADEAPAAVLAEAAPPSSPPVAAEDLEIILTPAPARTERDAPRVWPAIAQEEPDTSAFEPVILANGAVAETLAMAVADALEENPEIQIAAAQRDDAHFGVQEARAALLPTVDLQAANGHERTRPGDGEGSDHTRSEVSLSVRQNVYDFGVARNSLDSADSVADSADWAFRAQLDAVSLEIAQAFLQVLERQSIVALSEENLASHQRILETVRTQQEFGLVTGADVSRVEARLNAARADLLDQRSALAQAEENFRRLLDRAPGPLAEPVRVEALIPPTADEAVTLLDEMNPAVMQANLLLESLHEQRDSQRAGYMPRFDLEVTSSARDNAGGPNGRADESRAMINMRVPLYDGGAREAAIGRVTSRIRQAEFEVERARRDAEQAVRNDYQALSAAREKVDAIEDEVAAAERLVELYDEQFRQGSRSVFDLLDGQSTLYQAQVRRETNRTEMRLSGYRVLRTLGILFETITTPANQIPQVDGPTPAPRPTDPQASAEPEAAPLRSQVAPDDTVIAPPPAADPGDEAIILLPAADEAIGQNRRPG
jgi:TolC family type I secretion outer membrane protein